jgi:hypothetical protein
MAVDKTKRFTLLNEQKKQEAPGKVRHPKKDGELKRKCKK